MCLPSAVSNRDRTWGPPPVRASLTLGRGPCYLASHGTHCLSAGVEHRQLLDLAQKHFGSVSEVYTEDTVPTLAPCRFTGSEVGHLWAGVVFPAWASGGTLMNMVVFLRPESLGVGNGSCGRCLKHTCSHMHVRASPTPATLPGLLDVLALSVLPCSSSDPSP